MPRYFYGLIFLLYFSACSENKKQELTESELPGSVLAVQHCSSCHLPVTPNLLPKSVWENAVLPSMGLRLGFHDGSGPPDSLFSDFKSRAEVEKANIFPLEPTIHPNDWNKIVAYFLENAPDSISPPIREVGINLELPHFKYKKSQFSITPPLCIMVKIIPENHEIAFSDGKKDVSSLVLLDANLQLKHKLFVDRTPIDYQIINDTAYMTSVGKKVFPSDEALGMVEQLYSTKPDAAPDRSNVLLNKLQRPVNTTYADLNEDGMTDIVACEYGYHLGKLVWYENLGRNNYTMHYLSKEPGASIAKVVDVDGDGSLDIVALMAQGKEGIYLYKNSPAGFLRGEPLLTFSPLAGSTYFDLVDFNDDGHLDIIYTSGDNADLTHILKSYHGIYIYLNDGNFQFEKMYFYQMNGAYKALARDFDLDGDLDIAAISFFPDYARYPEEAFVYLQNSGFMDFEAFSFPEVSDGRWIVMDAKDLDGDGDDDIALGSFVSFQPEGDTTGLFEKWVKEGPSVVLLENTIR